MIKNDNATIVDGNTASERQNIDTENIFHSGDSKFIAWNHLYRDRQSLTRLKKKLQKKNEILIE